MRHPRILISVVVCLLLATGAAHAQSCPTLIENPVPSYSPEDIPATNVDIITYTGAIVKARANHNLVYVQITPNDQRVWFGPDASPGLYRTFYNRRIRDNESSPWRWLYSPSPEIIRYQAPASAGPASVHYSDTPKYRDPASNMYFKFVMYQVVQPGTCDGGVAGFLHVSFSNDGICWTTPRQATRWNGDGPSFGCYPGHYNTVPIEQMQAIDGGDRIYLVGVEGDINTLILPPWKRATYWEDNQWKDYYTYERWSQMDRSLTFLGWASYTDPSIVNLYPTSELSTYGMFQPQGRYSPPPNQRRYVPYAYFMNLSIAYDPTGGYFYIARGYPYPYERGSYSKAFMEDPESEPVDYPPYDDGPTDDQTPSNTQMQARFLAGPNGNSLVEGCLGAPYTLPNRVQLYRMNIGALSNITRITTGTNLQWQLLADLGGSTGYEWWGSTPAALVTGQTNAGEDFGAVSFIRDRNGNLLRNASGQGLALASHTFMARKSAGPCRITGLEREVLVTVP